VKSIFVDGGRVPPGTQEVRRAALIINYTPKKDRKITQRQLELEIGQELENVPDIRFWFLDENGLRAISLVVTGIDSNIVNNVASELATQMKRIPIIANVISETALDRPELRIRPRAELAARLGVSTESLSQTIRVATIGDVGPALAKFDAGDRQVPIRVQLEDSARSDLQMLQQLRVPLGQRGERGGVPLSVVADIQLDQGPTSINRYDRERQATVAADLVGNAALGDATKLIYDLPVMKSLPKGVRVSPSGDAESLNELSEGFATAITAGLMMVYAVLVLLFGTFLQPITILFSLPLSIGGAIAALLLTGKQLTTPVWIGILMLMGIVTKNAIMLVEFAVEAIREGKKREEAMIDAGMKRARPIVMTTIAMAAGMMPSALAFGAGGEFRSPMALAVIGGLLFSTILSLVFVPAMFMVMDDFGALCWRFGRKLIVSSAESEPADHGQDHRGEPPAKGPPAAPPAMSPAAE
jgi:multidrug efflux pump subunit AcrB